MRRELETWAHCGRLPLGRPRPDPGRGCAEHRGFGFPQTRYKMNLLNGDKVPLLPGRAFAVTATAWQGIHATEGEAEKENKMRQRCKANLCRLYAMELESEKERPANEATTRTDGARGKAKEKKTRK